MASGDDTERNERNRENQRERQNSQSEDRRRRSRRYSTSDDRRVRLSSVSEDQTYIVVMEFEERHKNFLKCPEQIQESISSSPIDNTHITDLRHNHTRGMLIFSINKKVEALKLIPLEEFGGKPVVCRWSKDTDIQQGVIGPIQCPLQIEVADQKIIPSQ